MWGVLDHLSLCYRLGNLSILFTTLSLVLLLGIPYPAAAQTVVNGQIFTNGLAIVDAPAVGSQFHAGSNIPIAIDVSGDGKLPQVAANPDTSSALWTGFDSLELYLVSAQTNLNLTVSNGTEYLSGEPGSTVKHLDFDLPSCVPAGAYNFTVYERSHINNVSYFSITPIAISILNEGSATSSNDSCEAASNVVQPVPQPSSPIFPNPLIGSGSATVMDTSFLTMPTSYITYASSYPMYASSGMVTVTIGSGGVVLPSPTGPGPVVVPSVITTTLSGGATTTITFASLSTSFATTSAPPTTVTDTITIILVSLSTSVTTISGQPVTTTISEVTTTTATMQAVGTDTGFLPVNSARAHGPSTFLLCMVLSMLLLILR